MVRSVSWLTLRSPFATAATSRRANAQMRREFDEMADRFQDELDEVHAKLAGAPRLAWALAGRSIAPSIPGATRARLVSPAQASLPSSWPTPELRLPPSQLKRE